MKNTLELDFLKKLPGQNLNSFLENKLKQLISAKKCLEEEYDEEWGDVEHYARKHENLQLIDKDIESINNKIRYVVRKLEYFSFCGFIDNEHQTKPKKFRQQIKEIYRGVCMFDIFFGTNMKLPPDKFHSLLNSYWGNYWKKLNNYYANENTN